MGRFEPVQNFMTREWRGPDVFMCHWSGAGFPDTPNWKAADGTNYSNMTNSWLRVPVPYGVPASAKLLNVVGMFVGGVQPQRTTFMVHIDFADPANAAALPAGDDWTANGGQGDFYEDFDTPHVRRSFGGLWVPVADGVIMLRWKIDPAIAYQPTDGAWGIHVWCQGYAA